MSVEPKDILEPDDLMPLPRAGRIRMAPELLLNILGLDRKHRIVGIRDRGPTMEGPSVIEIFVTGPMMPEQKLGEVAPEVEVVYRKRDYDLVDVRRSFEGAA